MDNSRDYKAIVFTTFKSQSGFIVHATQRGDNLETAYKQLGVFIKSEKGTPYEKASGFAKKVIEYTGELCPLDKGRLIKPSAPNRPIKCENGTYDFRTKTSGGCAFVKWPQKSGFEQDMEPMPDDIKYGD